MHTQITLDFHLTLLRQTPEVLPSVWGSWMGWSRNLSFRAPHSPEIWALPLSYIHGCGTRKVTGSHCSLSLPLPEMNTTRVTHLRSPFLQVFLSHWCWSKRCDQLPRLLFHSWLKLAISLYFSAIFVPYHLPFLSHSCCLLNIIIFFPAVLMSLIK